MTENAEKKVDDRKPLKLPPLVHREIKIESARTGRTMQELIDEAWAVYKRSRTQTGIEHPPDTVPAGTAIVSPHYGNPAEVARRAARVVTLLEEAKALVEEAARADTGGEARGPKHTPRKRAGGSQ